MIFIKHEDIHLAIEMTSFKYLFARETHPSRGDELYERASTLALLIFLGNRGTRARQA